MLRNAQLLFLLGASLVSAKPITSRDAETPSPSLPRSDAAASSNGDGFLLVANVTDPDNDLAPFFQDLVLQAHTTGSGAEAVRLHSIDAENPGRVFYVNDKRSPPLTLISDPSGSRQIPYALSVQTPERELGHEGPQYIPVKAAHNGQHAPAIVPILLRPAYSTYFDDGRGAFEKETSIREYEKPWENYKIKAGVGAFVADGESEGTFVACCHHHPYCDEDQITVEYAFLEVAAEFDNYGPKDHDGHHRHHGHDHDHDRDHGFGHGHDHGFGHRHGGGHNHGFGHGFGDGYGGHLGHGPVIPAGCAPINLVPRVLHDAAARHH
ncbi:hypothetical protein SPI_07096 [Niveomyces insectorum RCEF 264]|uniref:DUF7907 domain-containing protein n=1 Tax=Niveomyces insectorum RCEF 264 TaxID=1081102 RepID=A0A167Q9R3_9HYPO|nr:hypothetical protein SPI_07096 [Niveomyces insectorum RCEF 264]